MTDFPFPVFSSFIFSSVFLAIFKPLSELFFLKECASILINIFAGITRCDDVAEGIKMALAKSRTQVPIVVRMVGTNSGEGLKILEEWNLATSDTLYEAVQKAVAFGAGGWNGHPG